MLVACGAVAVVVLTAVALVVAKANTTTSSSALSGPAAPVDPTGQALSALVASTTSVPASTLLEVGAGSGADKPASITGTAPRLTLGVKPEVLYVGAEYCPYCAAERWALIVALSRFGTFSGLATTHSAIRDGGGTAEPNPFTRTFTFAHAKYESKYLSFVGVELNTNVPDKITKSYGPLQTPTHFEQSVMDKYDAPPYVPSSDKNSIPFTDFGNRYMIAGASFDPSILSGLSWTQIARDLRNPSSPVAKAILGTANYMTAALCQMANDHPSSVCTAAVRQLQRKI